MRNYVIYTSEYGNNCIVEVCSSNPYELHDIQKQLIEQGFIIEEVIGNFIRCYKVGNDEVEFSE